MQKIEKNWGGGLGLGIGLGDRDRGVNRDRDRRVNSVRNWDRVRGGGERVNVFLRNTPPPPPPPKKKESGKIT